MGAVEMGVTEGFFVKADAGEISNPKIDACIVLQTRTANSRTAGRLYIWKGAGTGWVEYTASLS